jgi:hypothetical protein
MIIVRQSAELNPTSESVINLLLSDGGFVNVQPMNAGRSKPQVVGPFVPTWTSSRHPMRDYPVTLLADCCAARTRLLHELSIEVLTSYQLAEIARISEGYDLSLGDRTAIRA